MQYKISQAWHTGEVHRNAGIACQDKVYMVRVEDVFCVTLADGAGSQKYSEYGAACVSVHAAEEVCGRFDELWNMEPEETAAVLIDECLCALSQMVLPFEELGSTLLFFAGHKDGRYLSGHLGDGVQILVSGEEKRLSVFSEPENGQYANETVFTTSFNAEGHFRLKKGTLCGRGALLLMSDGMAESLYSHSSKTPASACRTIAEWMDEYDEQTVHQALQENMEMVFSLRSQDDLSLSVVSWSDTD